MNKIKVSEIGEVDPKSIEALSYDELKAWIDLRLHGKDFQIPLDFRQGESLYYIISLLYPKFNRYVREDINRIVSEFIRDMARNPATTWTGEAGHNLLLLINSIRADGTVHLLLEMAESRQFFDKAASSLPEDLHFRALQTLAALDYRATPEFWREQYALAPDRYAKIVFDGLSLIAPEHAIHFLAQLDSAETVNRILWTAFPLLLDEQKISRIAPLIEKSLPDMKPDVREAVIDFFKDEGYTLDYQPQKDRRQKVQISPDVRDVILQALAGDISYMWMHRSYMAIQENQWDKASLYYDQGRTMSNDNFQFTVADLVFNHMMSNRISEVISQMEILTENNPQAALKDLTKDWQGIQNYGSADSQAQAHLLRGQIRLKLNDAPGAIEDAEAALKFYRAQNVQTQDAKAAEELLEKAKQQLSGDEFNNETDQT